MSDRATDASPPRDSEPGASSEFQKVGQLRHATRSTLGWLSALFCAVCLGYLSILPLLPFMLLMYLAMYLFGVDSLASLTIAGLLSSLVFFTGMVIGRFLLRAVPPRLSGKRRNGVLALLAVATISFVANIVLQAVKMPDVSQSAGEVIADPAMAETFNSVVGSTTLRIVNTFSLVFYWLGFAVPLAARHLNPRGFLKEPFVLFLRRFSGFSDRSVQDALLKCAPAGKPVTFLTPTGSRAGDWNPFRVGFSGIKLRRAIRSMPVILRSTNEDWRRAASDLIDHAEVLVLDVSEGSGAIQFEVEMIDEADRWKDVVILTNKRKPTPEEAEELSRFAAKGAEIITYRKSWTRAIPRLLSGYFVTFLVVLPLFILVPMLGRMGLAAVTQYLTAGALDPADLMQGALPGALGASSLFNAAIYFWIYFVFFFRPSMDRRAAKALTKKLKSG